MVNNESAVIIGCNNTISKEIARCPRCYMFSGNIYRHESCPFCSNESDEEVNLFVEQCVPNHLK